MNTARPHTTVVFFCKFPPPINGQTLVTEAIVGIAGQDFEVETIDIYGTSWVGRDEPLWIPRRIASIAGQTERLVRRLRRGDVDVLYVVPSCSALGRLRDLYILERARPHVDRIVAHVHCGNFHQTFEPLWARPMGRRFVGLIDTFIFLSDGLSAKSAPFIPAAKHAIVPNPVDPAVAFTDAEVDDKIARRMERDHLNVLFLANMIRSKGYFDLLEALILLDRRGEVAFEADFVGEWIAEADQREFRARVEAAGLADRVRHHGLVADRGRIKEHLRQADVVALPSYYPVEAQPRSILEGMNAAAPVVATDHGAIAETVVDRVHGMLVPPQDPPALAGALSALAPVEQWEPMAHAARARFGEQFGPAMICERLQAALAGPDRPA